MYSQKLIIQIAIISDNQRPSLQNSQCDCEFIQTKSGFTIFKITTYSYTTTIIHSNHNYSDIETQKKLP